MVTQDGVRSRFPIWFLAEMTLQWVITSTLPIGGQGSLAIPMILPYPSTNSCPPGIIKLLYLFLDFPPAITNSKSASTLDLSILLLGD